VQAQNIDQGRPRFTTVYTASGAYPDIAVALAQLAAGSFAFEMASARTDRPSKVPIVGSIAWASMTTMRSFFTASIWLVPGSPFRNLILFSRSSAAYLRLDSLATTITVGLALAMVSQPTIGQS
jgi:hypothetical protein